MGGKPRYSGGEVIKFSDVDGRSSTRGDRRVSRRWNDAAEAASGYVNHLGIACGIHAIAAIDPMTLRLTGQTAR